MAERRDSGQPGATGPAARSQWRRAVSSLRRSRAAVAGVLVLGGVLFLAISANWISPHNPNEQVLERRLLPPAWSEGGARRHLLGTDHLGGISSVA